jgi:hypothetical protein
MTKWIIDAPTWSGSALYSRSEYLLGWIEHHQGEEKPWYGFWKFEGIQTRKRFFTEAEARTWVEARVMEAMGATVHKPEWNDAIEAAAVRVQRWNSEAAMAAPAIRALKRGGGDE